MDGVNYFFNIFANFVNPDIHTQNIENMWMRVNENYVDNLEPPRELFQTNLSKLRFRNFHRNDDKFNSLMRCIADLYVV